MKKHKSTSKISGCRSTKFLPIIVFLLGADQLLGKESKINFAQTFHPTYEKISVFPTLELSLNIYQVDNHFYPVTLSKDSVENAFEEANTIEKIFSSFKSSLKIDIPDYFVYSKEKDEEIETQLFPSKEFFEWIKNKSGESNLRILVESVSLLSPKLETQECFFTTKVNNFPQLLSLIKTGKVFSKVFFDTPKINNLEISNDWKFIPVASVYDSSFSEQKSFSLSPEPLISINLFKKIFQLGFSKVSVSETKKIDIQDYQSIETDVLDVSKLELQPESSIIVIPVAPIDLKENAIPPKLSLDSSIVATQEESPLPLFTHIILHLDNILKDGSKLNHVEISKVETSASFKQEEESIYEKAELEFAETIYEIENNYFPLIDTLATVLELDDLKVSPLSEILGNVFNYPSKTVNFLVESPKSHQEASELQILDTSLSLQEATLAPKINLEPSLESSCEVLPVASLPDVIYDIKPIPSFCGAPIPESSSDLLSILNNKKISFSTEKYTISAVFEFNCVHVNLIQVTQSFAEKTHFTKGNLENISISDSIYEILLNHPNIIFDIYSLPIYVGLPTVESKQEIFNLGYSSKISLSKNQNFHVGLPEFHLAHRDLINPISHILENKLSMIFLNSDLTIDSYELYMKSNDQDLIRFISSYKEANELDPSSEIKINIAFPEIQLKPEILGFSDLKADNRYNSFCISKLDLNIDQSSFLKIDSILSYSHSIIAKDLNLYSIVNVAENIFPQVVFSHFYLPAINNDPVLNQTLFLTTSNIKFHMAWEDHPIDFLLPSGSKAPLLKTQVILSKSNLVFFSVLKRELESFLDSSQMFFAKGSDLELEKNEWDRFKFLALEESLKEESFFASADIIHKLPEIISSNYDYVTLLSQNEDSFDPFETINIINTLNENDSNKKSLLKKKSTDHLTIIPTLRELNTYVVSTEFRNEVEVIASPDGNHYYFSAKIIPYYPEDFKKIHQNVYFVLDQSRTISEERFEAFKKGIIRSIPYLSPDATFNIVILNKNCEILSQSNLYNDKYALDLAKNFLDKISYGFITSPQDYTKALSFIKRKFEVKENALNTVILLSDGSYYKNYRADHDKIAELCQYNEDFFQIYTVAASQDNYLGALDMISFFNHGELLYSKTHVALPRQMAILVKNLKNPIASNLYLSTIRNESNQVEFLPASGQIQAFYTDRPFVVYGKTDRLQSIDLMIQGKVEDEWINITQKIDLRQAKSGDRELLRNCQMLEKKLSYFEETTQTDET